MTLLQRLAFDRIELLSTESIRLLPSRIGIDDESVEISTCNIKSIRDSLYEQQEWLDALKQEDNCIEDDVI